MHASQKAPLPGKIGPDVVDFLAARASDPRCCASGDPHTVMSPNTALIDFPSHTF